ITWRASLRLVCDFRCLGADSCASRAHTGPRDPLRPRRYGETPGRAALLRKLVPALRVWSDAENSPPGPARPRNFPVRIGGDYVIPRFAPQGAAGMAGGFRYRVINSAALEAIKRSDSPRGRDVRAHYACPRVSRWLKPSPTA